MVEGDLIVEGEDVLGRRVVTVAPEGDGTMISASEDVPTTARASVGKVIACRPAG